MSPAAIPEAEAARLELLLSYRIMDTPAEEVFDDLAWLAAQICEAPIGLVTFVAGDRQWFKARVGLDLTSTPRADSFCAHTILHPGPLVVSDATRDDRFAANPLVAGPPYFRFYAGVPLRPVEGRAVGTLCVYDAVPRQLTTAQQGALVRLARLAVGQLELRRTSLELDSARIMAGTLAIDRVPFDLHSLATDTLDRLRPGATAQGLELIHAISPDLPRPLVGDPARLRQLLQSLIGDAAARSVRGQVRLEIEREEGTAAHALLQFRILTSGDGIGAHTTGATSSRADSAGQFAVAHSGGGLGLPVCQRLVQLMGGTFATPAGAAHDGPIRFSLPFSVSEAAAPRSAVEPRVLVVDDNSVNQKVAARMLARLGCVVDVAANGREAVEMVGRTRYAVVFMDCMMPEMDGYEATGAIRQLAGADARTPIVAMTANAMQGDRERCLASGMDDYLSKPVQPELLRRALQRWTGVPASEPATAPAVDERVLESLRQLQEEGGPDIVAELIQTFLADLPGRRAAIRQALSGGDPEHIRAAAHTLKSSAAYMGAEQLARLCRELEATAQTADLATAARTGAALEEEAERVMRFLQSAAARAASCGRP